MDRCGGPRKSSRNLTRFSRDLSANETKASISVPSSAFIRQNNRVDVVVEMTGPQFLYEISAKHKEREDLCYSS